MTIASRVIEELRRHGAPLDDDELARRLSVSPRQTINQVCRKLAAADRLHRYTGPDGKIVNDLRSSAEQPAATTVLMPQRRAEAVMLEALGDRLGVALAPRRIQLDDGVRVEVDGADEGLSVLVEAWAHHGLVKSAQRTKVLADAFKLLHVASCLPVAPRLVLCLCDQTAATPFIAARSWPAHALRSFAIDVMVVSLPDDLRAEVLAAQRA